MTYIRMHGKKIPEWLWLLVLLLSVFLLYSIYLNVDYLLNPYGSHPREESQFESEGSPPSLGLSESGSPLPKAEGLPPAAGDECPGCHD